MSGKGFDWNTVFNLMTPQQIEEANVALDEVIKAEKAAMKKK